MSNNMTESGRKAAEIKAQKRAAALRENLKRRKNSEAAREVRGEKMQNLKTVNEDEIRAAIAARAFPGILADHQIRDLSLNEGMIDPFVEKQNHDGVISYGLSSYGYDARCSSEFKIFTNVDNAIVDPKIFSKDSFVDRDVAECIIPPNSFVLTRSVEYFRIPKDVLVICLGKSTYARCGLIVNVTPLEPGWEGHVTLEISNTTPLPAKVYANEGVAQFLFFKGSAPCEISYADRAGKYMGQRGVTLPRMKE